MPYFASCVSLNLRPIFQSKKPSDSVVVMMIFIATVMTITNHATNTASCSEHGDRSDGVAGGGPSLSSMRELHGLVAAAFPIAVTEDDFLQKKKIVYIKDEASGIYYELEDIEFVPFFNPYSLYYTF